MKKKILLAIGAIIIVIQFFQIDKTRPEVESSKDFITMELPPQKIQDLLHVACYDCNSYETKYPWYTNIAPFSWWIKHHINDGRNHLNFAIWGDYELKKANHKLEECYEMLESAEMPMDSYTWLHPEALLTPVERTDLIAYFKEKAGK